MINFLHNYLPHSELFSLGLVSVKWYGFLMVLGGILGFLMVLKLSKIYYIKQEKIYDLAFWWLIFAVVGARIYYVIYAWEFYKDDWNGIFRIWEGGMAVHGVMIGGFLATFIFAYKNKIKTWLLFDLAATGLSCAQIIGRWGNYFNQELFGKPTDLPWGIPISQFNRPIQYASAEYFHPTFLYESLLSVLIFLLLYFLHRLRYKKGIYRPGNIFLTYLLAYSSVRFVLEFLRTDYSPEVFGVRWAQIISALIIIAAVTAFALKKRRKTKQLGREN